MSIDNVPNDHLSKTPDLLKEANIFLGVSEIFLTSHVSNLVGRFKLGRIAVVAKVLIYMSSLLNVREVHVHVHVCHIPSIMLRIV